MRKLRENAGHPKISFLLLDWSVRESFHVLEYLNRQRVARADFEIVWVEYYDRRAPQIDALLEKHERLGLPTPIDTWLVMDTPRDQCYHKHKMYNAGILAAKGEIVVIMDSDSIVRTDFVEAILAEFARTPRLVLHLEQIRNFDRRFYPFSFPTIAEIIGPGCVNAIQGVPKGFDGRAKSLKKDWKLWHAYNYGACFCARREDLLRIGGSDEHQDYLGHVCGPYEMTARLINAGVEDRLHAGHWSFHVWHPNQGGNNNYCGPNNGNGMSTTAMALEETGRVLPLVENPQIRELRLALEQKPVHA